MREYVQGEVPHEPKAKVVRRREVKVPPFVSEPLAKATDTYRVEDAERHASMIRAAWKRAGWEVDVYVEARNTGSGMSYRVVMPEMVNGLPLAAYNRMLRKD